MSDIVTRVQAFYERHPYPPPRADLEREHADASDPRRRAEACLCWPQEPYRDDRHILVAGCGTSQAARYAMRWPRARVTGIDLSEVATSATERLKRQYGLDNLTVQQLAVERVAELGTSFDYVVCTGVLHHLADPAAGLRALRAVAAPRAALHVMLYAPYGRGGVYMLQEYCRRLGIGRGTGASAEDISQLSEALHLLPDDHPLVPLLRRAPDFRHAEGLADALLHPQDRAYTVPEMLAVLDATGWRFGRWLRQAPYLPQCGALASSPHRARLDALPAAEQYAAVELFRGSMVRHVAIAYRDDEGGGDASASSGDRWERLVPVRVPEAIVVRERLPAGTAAVLINPRHTYTDIYLAITEPELRLVEAIDGARTFGDLAAAAGLARGAARTLCGRLWAHDQVVFDATRA